MRAVRQNSSVLRPQCARKTRSARGHGIFVEALRTVDVTKSVLYHAFNRIEVLPRSSRNTTVTLCTVELQVLYKYGRCCLHDCCGTSDIQWLYHTSIEYYIVLYSCTVRLLSSPPPSCVVLEVPGRYYRLFLYFPSLHVEQMASLFLAPFIALPHYYQLWYLRPWSFSCLASMRSHFSRVTAAPMSVIGNRFMTQYCHWLLLPFSLLY